MIHTKKRLLAMLLAVVLMFSSLPFSVSADEVSSELPTESTVESQPEEIPVEDPAPSDGETSISVMAQSFSRPDPNDKGIRHAEAITQGQVDPLIFFHTFEEYLDFYLGTHHPETLTDVEWLSLP